MIKTFEPPFLLNAKSSIIKDKIKIFSSNLFANKIYGFFSSLIFNIYLIYCLILNKNTITILVEFIFFFLIQYIFSVNIFNIQKK